VIEHKSHKRWRPWAEAYGCFSSKGSTMRAEFVEKARLISSCIHVVLLKSWM
jgi:hypothetical protein